MKKRILSALLAVTVVSAMVVGCGSNSDSSDISTSDSNTDGLGTDTTTGSRSNRVITGKGGASE